MAELNLPVIDKTIHKTRLWLDDVMAATETMDRVRAFRALRAVLHGLRDNLEVEEVVRFAAQMPLLIRGLYYEGWKPTRAAERDRSVGDFLGRVAAEFGDFPTVDLERVCRSVVRVVANYVSPGEVRDVMLGMPPEIRDFLLAEEYRAPGQTVL